MGGTVLFLPVGPRYQALFDDIDWQAAAWPVAGHSAMRISMVPISSQTPTLAILSFTTYTR
jgi:hypothetical protein